MNPLHHGVGHRRNDRLAEVDEQHAERPIVADRSIRLVTQALEPGGSIEDRNRRGPLPLSLEHQARPAETQDVAGRQEKGRVDRPVVHPDGRFRSQRKNAAPARPTLDPDMLILDIGIADTHLGPIAAADRNDPVVRQSFDPHAGLLEQEEMTTRFVLGHPRTAVRARRPFRRKVTPKPRGPGNNRSGRSEAGDRTGSVTHTTRRTTD